MKTGRPKKNPELTLAFGMKLRLIRKEKNITQRELAKKLNISTAGIVKWETGIGYPSLERFVKICKELNVSADILLGIKPLVITTECNLEASSKISDEEIENAYKIAKNLEPFKFTDEERQEITETVINNIQNK